MKAKAEIIAITPNAEQVIEIAARTCYNSKMANTIKLQRKFISSLIKSGHESVIEHASATFEITCSRSCSHQIVRYRIASYSQRSQRRVSEGNSQYIEPEGLDNLAKVVFLNQMNQAEKVYSQLLGYGVPKEDARYVLPNACATEIVMTMNFRGWRHFIKERGLNPHAQWEISKIARDVLFALSNLAPSCFEDLNESLGC